MIIKTNESEVILKNDGVTGRLIFRSDKLEMVRITIEPQKEIAKHAVPFNAQFYVVDGEGIFFLGEESYAMKRDSMVGCPKEVERSWKNLSSVNLELLVIKNIFF